jgi:signal transduction histidine kinase
VNQAQKMESVGRLAGGVAHDFNNMLMGILGYADLCRDSLPAEHPMRSDLDEITKCANRSAELTRQLLAFARKQIIQPKVLDLNDAVSGMLTLLQKLIGENIKVTWMPGANPPPVKLDPSQVDQILTNLFLNARDAIGGVGKITVATSSATLDRAFCDDHPGASPGEYVLLRVSDTGCGMTKDVLANLFEPFFTTKDIGKGTGLGLATVHGIVMQNHGFIDVSSEPDKGTTFRIYLPVYSEEIDKTSVASSGEVPRGRGETILFVDDDRRKGGAGRKDALPPEAEQSRRHGPQGARGAG